LVCQFLNYQTNFMYLKIQAYPFVRFLIPLLIGLFIRFQFFPFLPVSFGLPVSIIIAVLILLFYPFKVKYNNRWVFGLLVSILLFLFGLCLKPNYVADVKDLRGAESFYAQVTRVLKSDEKQHLVELICHDNENLNTLPFKVLYKTDKQNKQPEFYPGDNLFFKSKVAEVKEATNPFAFSYKQYLKNMDVIGQLQNLEANCVYLGHSFHHRYYFEKIRKWAESKLSACSLSESEYGIVTALSLGDKSYLSSEVKSNFVNSGAIHVLSVSGLHVGIIYLLLLTALRFLDRLKLPKVKIWIVVFFLWFYAALTGLSPSVSRATIMFSVFVLSKLRKDDYNIYHSMGIAAFIILVLDPYAFISAGFWLSFTAVASIVYFYPLINNLFYFTKPWNKYLWSLISVSFAVEIGTAPIVVYLFGFFPTWFLISNLILIPILPFVLIAIILMLLAPVNSFVFKLLSGLVIDGARFINEMTAWIGNLPYARYSQIQIDVLLMVIWFVAVIMYVLYRNVKRPRYLLAMLVSMLVVLASFSYNRYKLSVSNIIVVHDVSRKTVVSQISPACKKCYLGQQTDNRILENVVSPLWSKFGIVKLNKHDISQEGLVVLNSEVKSILLVNKSMDFDAIKEVVSQVGVVVFTKNTSAKLIEKCLRKFQHKVFVFDSSWGYSVSVKNKKYWDLLNNQLHFVNIDGAFVFESI